NTAVSADVFRYGTVELRCYSPGEAISLAVDARGNPIQSSGPDDSDVYLALPPAAADGFFCRGYKTFADPQLSEPMIRFPAGAVSANVPESAFNTISARDWRNAVTEIPERAAGGVWLIRSRSGSTIKLVRHGPFAAAPAGGDFADRIQTVAPVIRIPVRLPPPPAHVRATVATDAGGTLFAPYGAGPGHPLLIGIPPRAGYTATLFGGSVAATVTPVPYTAPEPSWSLEGPLQSRGSYGGKLLVVGTQPGIGRVTATFDEPAHATASLRVIVYPTLAIGCGDIANGYGVAFDDDGTARVVGTPDEADLFASYDAHAFRCGGLVAAPGAMTRPPTPFTPGAPDTPASHADDDAGWYFPYGGVFFPNGNDPARSPPFGSPRGVAFDAVTAAHWRNDRTSERLAQYQADTFPCMRTQGSIGYSIPNCTTMPDGVLLIRTRRGRYVKLLWMGRGPGSFAGLYQVSRPDGTFAY
ncbi:MAG TPA: hypothetical protein VGX96_16660, partial [Candidatus Elarobacter sp.]|nr:hypothetical protein [Candidatus Elarobacter sp.]